MSRIIAFISILLSLTGCLNQPKIELDKVPAEKLGGSGTMSGFTVPPMDRIRVGFIGVGERGMAAFHRVQLFPGVKVTAVADIRQEAVDEALAFNRKWNLGEVHGYGGTADAWKKLCEDPAVDIVYILTPAKLHAEMEIYAMEQGKHVLVEVPGCMTLKECWDIVETAERTRRHCYLLENRCFREPELLAYSMAKQGVLGELAYAEAAYIHPLCWRHLEDHFRNEGLKKSLKRDQNWNTYPTHPLGPICRYLDINYGDRMTSLVSMSTGDFTHPAYAKSYFPPEAWQNKVDYRGADMNTTLIRTAKGRTIELKYCLSTPRPYTRINLLAGTKGIFQGEPFEIYTYDTPGGPYGWDNEPQYFDAKKREELREQYKHPLWKIFGPTVTKPGFDNKASVFFAGHGGVDYIMDMAWICALKTGQPMPQSVYDLATWSCIVDMTRESVQNGSKPVEIPDFTRGGWATMKPQPLETIDPKMIGWDPEDFMKKARAWSESNF